MTSIRLAAAAAVFAASPAFADPAGIDAVRAAWEAAFTAGDGKAAAEAIFAEDAVLMPNGSPIVRGRDGIAAFWQGVWDAGITGLQLETIAVDIQGDTAIVTGTWSIEVPKEGGGTMRVGGKDLVIYEKQADGTWLTTYDIWNDDN